MGSILVSDFEETFSPFSQSSELHVSLPEHPIPPSQTHQSHTLLSFINPISSLSTTHLNPFMFENQSPKFDHIHGDCVSMEGLFLKHFIFHIRSGKDLRKKRLSYKEIRKEKGAASPRKTKTLVGKKPPGVGDGAIGLVNISHKENIITPKP